MRIYLDWNATSPLLPSVREAMLTALDTPGNASSIHREGQAARAVVERARRALARALGVTPQQVILTGGATESNNHVLRTHARYTPAARLACLSVEHPSTIEVVEALAHDGHRAHIIAVDRAGRVDLASLDAALQAGATLVSVMWANNELGNIYPVAQLAERVHEAGALLHVDGTQAWGRLPVRMSECGADYLTLSFHKMGGPKGIGAIVTREGLALESMLSGGHQERGKRPGTENVLAAAGLEAAARACVAEQASWQATLTALRAHLIGALDAAGVRYELRGDVEACLPNTVNLAFEGVTGEDMLLGLDLEGVAASSGSACTAGSLEPSHVLLAMGYAPDEARRSVRLSFGPTTGTPALDEAVKRIRLVWERLRKSA
jgi:cysteine desulfurase